jgi:hypothetical protein
MRIIISICFIVHLIFGALYADNQHEIIHLYKQAKDLYLAHLKDPSLKPQFENSCRKIDSFIDGYEKDPTKLLNVLRQNGSRQVAHVIFGKMIERFYPHRKRRNLWEEHLNSDITSAISFFKRSLTLMYNFCTNNYSLVKEGIPIILSIQRRHLHHLRGDEDKLEEVKRWIKEYEFIPYTFEPGNLHVLLTLFRYLRQMAIEHKGVIPMAREHRFSILRALHLFKIHSHHCFHFHWEELKVFTAFPKYLLYHLMVDRSIRDTFRLLFKIRIKSNHCITNFFSYSKDFNNLRRIFEIMFKKFIIVFNHPMKVDPDFFQFLHCCIKGNGNPYNLSQRELWLIQVVFWVFSIPKN